MNALKCFIIICPILSLMTSCSQDKKPENDSKLAQISVSHLDQEYELIEIRIIGLEDDEYDRSSFNESYQFPKSMTEFSQTLELGTYQFELDFILEDEIAFSSTYCSVEEKKSQIQKLQAGNNLIDIFICPEGKPPIHKPKDADVEIDPIVKPKDPGESDNNDDLTGPIKDYAMLLDLSHLFYEAQRAGKKDMENYTRRVMWTKDSVLDDGAGEYFIGMDQSLGMKRYDLDLSGGWFDAGDHVKFVQPMAFSISYLSWGMIEFPRAYGLNTFNYDVDEIKKLDRETLKLSTYALENLKFATDFLMKLHVDQDTSTFSDDHFVYQVANGDDDHSFSGPAHTISEKRKIYLCTLEMGCSNIVGEASAALASAYMAFKKIGNVDRGDLLAKAKTYYELAKAMNNQDGAVATGNFYKSWNGFEDELYWAASWLYRATNEEKYLQEALSLLKEYEGWSASWDDKLTSAHLLLAQAMKANGIDTSKLVSLLEKYLTRWDREGGANPDGGITAGGLKFQDKWGPLRYTMNSSLLAMIFAKEFPSEKATTFQKAAIGQLHYIMGDNPRGGSYVIGYGSNYPKKPHHRSASGSAAVFVSDEAEAAFTLFGALVGGPNDLETEAWDDVRVGPNGWTMNEVATDYNAGYTGVVAAMVELCLAKSDLCSEDNKISPLEY